MNALDRISCNACKFNGDDVKAAVYCSTCKENLCFTCGKTHQGLRLTRGHMLVTITDTPPVVKREIVSTTSGGATTERISTTMVLRTNNSLTKSDPHNTGLCKKCSDKEENNSESARDGDCQKSNNERKATWNSISDDEQEPTLQKCNVHNAKVVKYYCVNHKKLCQDTSHQTCEKTLLPCISSNFGRLGETANDTKSEPITSKQANERVLVTGTLENTDASNGTNFLEMNIFKDREYVLPKYLNSENICSSTFLQNGDLIVYSVSDNYLVLYNSYFRIKSSVEIPSICSYSIFTADMCRTSETEIALTEPKLQKIQFVITEPIIKFVKSFKVDNPCYGIDCYLGMLYVICVDITNDKGEILIMTKEGQIQRRLDLNNDRYLLRSPRRIRVSSTSGRIFVADTFTNTVTCLTQSGDIVYKYQNTELRTPSDIYVDSEDNIIVCGYTSNNIHRVDKNGNHHSILISKSDGVISPRSISYRVSDGALAVAMNEEPSVLVYWLQK